jgi:hypothetical protein
MIDERFLCLGRDASGDTIWICGHCAKPADDVNQAENKDDLAYTLMCPSGSVKLGEWTDLETKNSELAEYKRRLINFSEDITQA